MLRRQQGVDGATFLLNFKKHSQFSRKYLNEKKIKSDVKIYSAMEYWFVIKHIYIYF